MFKLITPERFAACLVYALDPRGSYDCQNTLELAADECGVSDAYDVLDAIEALAEHMGC